MSNFKLRHWNKFVDGHNYCSDAWHLFDGYIVPNVVEEGNIGLMFYIIGRDACPEHWMDEKKARDRMLKSHENSTWISPHNFVCCPFCGREECVKELNEIFEKKFWYLHREKTAKIDKQVKGWIRKNPDEFKERFHSDEKELLLSFIMWAKHRKRWNGQDWISEDH